MLCVMPVMISASMMFLGNFVMMNMNSMMFMRPIVYLI
jgi:hypothetical protein